MVRLPRQQHLQHRVTQPLLGVLQCPGPLGGQGEQRDRGVHGIAPGRAERCTGPHREHPAGPAPGAQRLQLDPVIAVGVADDRAGGGGPLPQPPDVVRQPGRAAGRPVGGGGHHRTRRVVERGPAVQMGREPGQQLGRPLGAERRPGQLPLRLEARRHRAVLVGGDGRRHRLADRDERRPARHPEQRQPLLPGGIDQRLRHTLVIDPDREAQPDDPGLRDPPHIPPGRLRVLRVQLERGDQQQLPALHVRHRIDQLTRMRPAHRRLQPLLAREHGQLERGVIDQGSQGVRHGTFMTSTTARDDRTTTGHEPADDRSPPDCLRRLV